MTTPAGNRPSKTANIAGEANRAAWGPLEVSENTAQRQLRAYVFIESMTLRQPDTEDEPWCVQTSIKNLGIIPLGQVPASGSVSDVS